RQLALGLRRRERDREAWTLPKGTPNPGETLEQTALREVAEETGLEVSIIEPVGAIEYWFVLERTRIHKTVHYFLMTAIGGDLTRHDREFEAVAWVPLSEADVLMRHETERDIVARARPAIERHWPLPPAGGA
ncbi:MAG: NUDIX hydrolase, partial [Candidatus Limnocylindrales bacterium]